MNSCLLLLSVYTRCGVHKVGSWLGGVPPFHSFRTQPGLSAFWSLCCYLQQKLCFFSDSSQRSSIDKAAVVAWPQTKETQTRQKKQTKRCGLFLFVGVAYLCEKEIKQKRFKRLFSKSWMNRFGNGSIEDGSSSWLICEHGWDERLPVTQRCFGGG